MKTEAVWTITLVLSAPEIVTVTPPAGAFEGQGDGERNRLTEETVLKAGTWMTFGEAIRN